MTDGGQAQVVSVVSEIVILCAGLAGIYLVGAVVFTLAQSHLSAIGGEPRALSGLADQLIPAVICFTVALTAQTLGDETARIISSSGAASTSEALTLWEALATFIVNTVIYSVGASMAVGMATGAIATQLEVFVGQPRALSTLWSRLLMALGTGALTLVSVTIANAIIQSVL